MLKCPVCPVSDIPDNTSICPGCGTDVSPFRRVKELAKVHYNDAIRMVNEGAVDTAINRVMAALSIDDEFPEARKLLGKLFWRKKQFADAINQWQQLLAARPEDKEILELLTRAKHKQRRKRMLKFTVSAAVLAMFIFLLSTQIYVLLKVSTGQTKQPVEIALETALQNGGIVNQENQFIDRVSSSQTSNSEQDAGLHNLERMIVEIQQKQAALAKDIEADRDAISETNQKIEIHQHNIAKSLSTMLELLRPKDIEILEGQIKALELRAEVLRGWEEKYKSRDIFLIDAINRGVVKDRLSRVEKELELLKERYDRQMAPWNKALEIAKSLDEP